MAAERLRQFASAAAAAAVSITRPNYFDTSKRGTLASECTVRDVETDLSPLLLLLLLARV